MMSDYWEKDHALELNPAIQKLVDSVYRSLFPVTKIDRLANRKPEPNTLFDILDRRLHIDVILELDTGQVITIQEKYRRKEYADFNDFTLERYSNLPQQIPGEFFSLFAHLYSYLWINQYKPEILRHYIFKIPDFVLGLLQKHLKIEWKKNKDHSNADFFAFPFSYFPEEWFVYRYPKVELVDFI